MYVKAQPSRKNNYPARMGHPDWWLGQGKHRSYPSKGPKDGAPGEWLVEGKEVAGAGLVVGYDAGEGVVADGLRGLQAAITSLGDVGHTDFTEDEIEGLGGSGTRSTRNGVVGKQGTGEGDGHWTVGLVGVGGGLGEHELLDDGT